MLSNIYRAIVDFFWWPDEVDMQMERARDFDRGYQAGYSAALRQVSQRLNELEMDP